MFFNSFEYIAFLFVVFFVYAVNKQKKDFANKKYRIISSFVLLLCTAKHLFHISIDLYNSGNLCML